jgi:hypothetical protein
MPALFETQDDGQNDGKVLLGSVHLLVAGSGVKAPGPAVRRQIAAWTARSHSRQQPALLWTQKDGRNDGKGLPEERMRSRIKQSPGTNGRELKG